MANLGIDTLSSNYAATVPHNAVEPASTVNVFWALLTIALGSVTQQSFTSWICSARLFDNAIWPHRSSPFVCLADTVIELKLLFQARRRLLEARLIANPSVKLMKLTFFTFGVLPQVIYLFSIRGIPLIQTIAGVFAISQVVNILLGHDFKQAGEAAGMQSFQQLQELQERAEEKSKRHVVQKSRRGFSNMFYSIVGEGESQQTTPSTDDQQHKESDDLRYGLSDRLLQVNLQDHDTTEVSSFTSRVAYSGLILHIFTLISLWCYICAKAPSPIPDPATRQVYLMTVFGFRLLSLAYLAFRKILISRPGRMSRMQNMFKTDNMAFVSALVLAPEILNHSIFIEDRSLPAAKRPWPVWFQWVRLPLDGIGMLGTVTLVIYICTLTIFWAWESTSIALRFCLGSDKTTVPASDPNAKEVTPIDYSFTNRESASAAAASLARRYNEMALVCNKLALRLSLRDAPKGTDKSSKTKIQRRNSCPSVLNTSPTSHIHPDSSIPKPLRPQTENATILVAQDDDTSTTAHPQPKLYLKFLRWMFMPLEIAIHWLLFAGMGPSLALEYVLHRRQGVLWMTFGMVNFVTMAVCFKVFFDAEKTASPDWNSLFA